MLVVGDGESSLTVTPVEAFRTDHALMVRGLRPGRLNTIEVRIENERGLTSPPITIAVETAPLPDDLPPMDVVVSRPEQMEPGITLLPLFKQGARDEGIILAIDAQGDVVWSFDATVMELTRLRNGNLLFVRVEPAVRNGAVAEIDML